MRGVWPCTAPLTILIGGLWYRSNGEVAAKLAPTERAMCLIGLMVSALTTTGLIVVGLLHR